MLCSCGSKRSICFQDGTEKCANPKCGKVQEGKSLNYIEPLGIRNPFKREWLAKDPVFFGFNYKDLQCIRRA